MNPVGSPIHVCLILFTLLLGVSVRAAETPPEPAPAQVESAVRAQMSASHIPGLSLAVVRNGKVVLAEGYGLADMELNAPAKPNTVYQLASVTKQFTATAVMMLVEEGKISLDDKIAQRLPDLPAAWGEVTVRQLLSHTSGIKGYTETPGFEKRTRVDMTSAEILGLVKELPLEFKPGEKWEYSNTGYFLLGMLIEKASGKSYGEFLAERIFSPLGMASTRVNDLAEIIPNRASGYAWRGKVVNAERTSPTQPFSAGALVSTVEDMAKWDAALYTEKLLKKATLEQMWTAASLSGGGSANYGFGWAVGRPQGHRLVGHGGGITGFSTQIDRYRDDGLTVVVLANQGTGNAGEIARRVAALYIPALVPPEPKPIEDKDPQLTTRLKAIVVSIAEGKADPNEFAPQTRAILFPDRIKQGQGLSQLGPLKSFILTETMVMGDLREYRYVATFGTTNVRVDFVLNKEGKIAGLMLRPE